MATGANATPLGKLHPSIGAKRGFDAGPGAGNGLMPTPGPAASFPSMQGFQPSMPNASFTQFSPVANYPNPSQQSAGSGMSKSGKWNDSKLRLLTFVRRHEGPKRAPLHEMEADAGV